MREAVNLIPSCSCVFITLADTKSEQRKMDTAVIDTLLLELESVKAVKFGDFKLKSGIWSPAYFDLRVIVSYPEIMETVSEFLWKVRGNDTKVDVLCGVPYTALPLATIISCKEKVPMLIRRKEAKDYGTKKMLEGNFEKGQNCLIIEDVVTSGTSVLETAKLLRDHGLVVTDAVVLLNREQGGAENLARNGIRLHSVCGVYQLVDVLLGQNRIGDETARRVIQFVKNNQVGTMDSSATKHDPLWKKPFQDRLSSGGIGDSMSKRVLECILNKKSNLCVAIDVSTADSLISLAKKLGPYVCCIKTHVDAISDWSRSRTEELADVAKEEAFLLFEDRKFADIGNTVAMQYAKIADWADIVTVHGLPGKGLIDGLRSKVPTSPNPRGALILAQMSCEGNLITPDYTAKCMELCNGSFLFGYVGQSRLSDRADIIQFTPGVNLSSSGDSLGQKYVSPEQAVIDRGADVVIVGRGVTGADDVVEAAERYRLAAWNSYLKRCQKNN